VSDLFGTAVDVTHRHDDAEHGGDDAETGERVTGGADQVDRLMLFVVMGLHLRIEELRELGGGATVDELAKAADQEVDCVVSLQDRGELFEDGALVRILNVRFERDDSLATHRLEDLKEALQQIEKVGFGG